MPQSKETKQADRSKSKSRWSAEVTENSDALDLENHVFAKRSPTAIAQSLKRSAERSRRRKSTPFQSAMSMLTFYINRAERIYPSGDSKRFIARRMN